MRKMLVLSAMGLLALGMEAVGVLAVPIPDARRFIEHDIQAPLQEGDDFQAPWLEAEIQAP